MTARVGLVAGEPSGDLIAAQVVAGLQQRTSPLILNGIGGPHLAQTGMEIWHPMDALSVFGYVDALKSLPRLYRIFTDVQNRWRASAPDVFIGVDAPDFNLRLEQKLHQYGIPTVHFVSPSIWAWRYERIEKIRQSVSHMLVLFPFELDIYQREGIAATYVGHPLADKIPLHPDRAASRRILGLDAQRKIVAILPGSRSSEIRLMAPRFLRTAQILLQHEPEMQFVVPLINAQRRAEFESILHQFPVPGLVLVDQSALGVAALEQSTSTASFTPSWHALAACDMTLVTSGTATLEAALFKRPMVISYVLSPLMRRIMAWKSGQDKPTLPWVGLPNVLAQSFVVPELLQDEATPENLAQAFLALWCDSTRRQVIEQQFAHMHETLRCNTAERASAAILKVLQERK
jgi:lipid-A-disaccharide synthase